MSTSMYPAPRWFREVVQGWLDDQGMDASTGISDLFTRIVNAQPPDLRVVDSSNRKDGVQP